jgi:DNA mismatch repair ATPase MutS
MSKIYEKYLELKSNNKDKMYLFHCGKFYIFVGDDVDKINNYIVLKKVPFCKETDKCGFPDSSLNDYLRVFNNQSLDIEVIENIGNESKGGNNNIVKALNKLDINNLTPMEALLELKKLKELVLDE